MTAATTTVFERMVAVLGELPAIGKTDYNEQQKFHFRGHDAVLNALNPLLAKHGVFVVPNVLERATSERTTRSGSAMFEVSLHVAFTFYGASGDSFTGSAWGEGTDMGDKATSKAMTMAFKSMVGQAFAISTAETVDPDATTAEESAPRGGASQSSVAPGGASGGSGAVTAPPTTESPAPPNNTISEAQQKRLFAISKDAGVEQVEVKRIIKEIAGVDSSSLIPKAKYDAVCEAVQAAGVPF